MSIKGYKVFDEDWTCNGFRYEVGKTYTLDGELVLCKNGFHFCRKAVDCFNYKGFNPKNKCAEIEAIGNIIDDDDKSVTDKIVIVREIPWAEMLELCNDGDGNTGLRNSGDRNSGNWNSGDWNSGDWNSGSGNSGNRNSGNWNSGYRNSGDYNSGSYNSGYFCTDEPPVRMFNKNTKVERFKIKWPSFFNNVNICTPVVESGMSDEEKAEHQEYKTTGEYLKTIGYKDAWRKAFDEAKAIKATWTEEKRKLLALPNFNYRIFEEITGISKKDIEE